MKHLGFYFRHALSHMNRNRQRTLFVLFCIAVGVAAVVSLRTLGLMIGDALTGNLQETNRGDIVITPPDVLQALTGRDQEVDRALIEGGGLFETATFSDLGIERIQAWAAENGYDLLLAARNQVPGRVHSTTNTTDQRVENANIYAIQPDGYPFYGQVTFIDPPNATLAQALAAPDSIVITARLANSLQLSLGDAIRIAGPDQFTITGIVDDGSEASLSDPNTYLFPFAYIAYNTGTTLLATKADTIYVRTPAGSDIATIQQAFAKEFPGLSLSTTADLRERNSRISDIVTRFITTMGLVSLLIGGIGIVNTMIVVVSRRALEIGVLKTIGLQGSQITLMFLIEALLLGIMGSLLGVGLGLGLVVVLQAITERVFAQTLNFALYPEAMLLGFITGVIVTLVFGFLPTIAAGRVRPNVVLSPNDAVIPRSGRVISLIIILLMTGIMGLMVGFILQNYLAGLGVAYLTLVVLAACTIAFWLLAFIFSRLPAFGSIYLKLAQRAVGANAGRTASTLLALVVGMFSLSLILLMTRSLVNVVNDVLETQLGGNLLASTESAEAGAALEAQLASLPAIRSYDITVVYNSEIVAINGSRDMDALMAAATAAGQAELFGEEGASPEGGLLAQLDPVAIQLNLLLQGLTLQRASDYRGTYEVARGQALPAGDNTPTLILQESMATRWLGLDVGDTLTLRFPAGQESTVTIGGIIAEIDPSQVNISTGSGANAIMTDNSLPAGVNPQPPAYVIDVDPNQLNQTINTLSRIDGVYAFDISQISALINRLFSQIAALPLVVAVLALFASSVIIANTVSLATLERRREIGIMKALGLQSSQVLRLLLLENGLVGLLGGLIGTGIGAAFILLSGILTDSLGSFPILTLAALVLLAILIALAATLLTAYGASREKPLIVLRYE